MDTLHSRAAREEGYQPTPLADILAEADNVEVNPCRFVRSDEGDYYEQIHSDDDDADFPFCWSVYLHVTKHGIECIADCPTKEFAEELAAILLPLCQKRGRP